MAQSHNSFTRGAIYAHPILAMLWQAFFGWTGYMLVFDKPEIPTDAPSAAVTMHTVEEHRKAS